MIKTIETKYYKVSYKESDELKQKVFDAVISWYKKHQSFDGESIMQYDNTLISAPELLSEIADDLIKFKIECNDDE